jgi:hypothetical protein
MTTKSLGVTAAVTLAFAVALVGCSGKPKGPGLQDLQAQLQQEAEALKAENENKDVDLGVKTTWRIRSVDVVEQPDNEKAPWRGSIVFAIRSETEDGGKAEVNEFDKEFAYVFNPTIQKWIFDYKP